MRKLDRMSNHVYELVADLLDKEGYTDQEQIIIARRMQLHFEEQMDHTRGRKAEGA